MVGPCRRTALIPALCHGRPPLGLLQDKDLAPVAEVRLLRPLAAADDNFATLRGAETGGPCPGSVDTEHP